MGRKKLELAHRQFERLTVTDAFKFQRGGMRWFCVCRCGNTVWVKANHLISERIRSCGCLFKKGNHLIHGGRHTSEYGIWKSMKSRCFNSNAQAFKNYGGRGITVCDRWKDSFQNFLADMGHRPPGMSIERNSNDGNYEPNNCEWATRKKQANNTRRSRH
jgi:hypothetical protein